MRFPYKSRSIPSKMFFPTNGAEVLQICRAASSVAQFVGTSKVFPQQPLRKGADHLDVKK